MDTQIATIDNVYTEDSGYQALEVNTLTVRDSNGDIKLSRDERLRIMKLRKNAESLAHSVPEGTPFTVVAVMACEGVRKGDAEKHIADAPCTDIYFVTDTDKCYFTRSEGIKRDLQDYCESGIIELDDSGNMIPVTFAVSSVQLAGGRTVKRLNLV